MNTEEFDDIIRNKVTQPAASEGPRDWDLFMLSAIDKGEEKIFEDHPTDRVVNEALGEFKADYNAGHWDLMARKLDEEVPDQPVVHARFDKTVSNSLKGITRKYDASTWPKLAARIEAEEKYLRHYYRAKMIEAVLFCLLVLTLFQISRSGKFTPPFIKTAEPETALRNNSNNDGDQAIATLYPKTENNTSIALNNSSGNTAGTNSPGALSATTSGGMDLTSASRPVVARHDVLLERISSRQSLIGSGQIYSRLDGKVKSLPLLQELSGEPVEDGEEALLAHQLVPVPEPSSLELPDVVKLTVKGGWKLGMYSHFDYNQIYLPDQQFLVFGKKSDLYPATTVSSTGYGAGFKMHYLKNRFGLEFGLGYANRSYSPSRAYYLDPYWNINFKKIEYDIVALPIAVRYTTKSNTRLKPYAMAGINANFIAKAIYDVLPEIKQVNFNGERKLNAVQNSIYSRVQDQFTHLDRRRALLYGQGSLGLEWKVNSSLDVYSQLTYAQRFLNRQFGPNWDQFRSLSLEIGLKTGL